MLYCLNPNCSDRLNADCVYFCKNCGSQLLLRNRYRVIKPIGGGGFGKTYEAVDQDCMNAPCVVKQFAPSAEIQANPAALQKATELFNQEGVRLFELGEHSQIPRLLAHFEQNKCLYLVQELIDGQTLRQELAIQGAFSEEKIVQLLSDLLPVLKFIHENGIIHRDIKPENIMRRRKDGKLVLIDFGVSKQATVTALGQVGTTVCTAGYTPIEQMRGMAYPASDIYSLAVTCIRLITQCLPKADGSDELFDPLEGRWLWRDRVPKNATISATLEQVLDKMLAELPKNRYQSAAEILQEIAPHDFEQPEASETLLPAGANPIYTATTSAPVITSPPINLSLEVEKVYSKLEELLAAGKWREADEETRNVVLRVAGQKPGWITQEDVDKFPCEALRIIDHLWSKYSNARFGLIIQKRIWDDVGGTPNPDYESWCRFGDRIGWRDKGRWRGYRNLIFSLDAPVGHLPGAGFGGAPSWITPAFAARLAICNLN